MIEITKGSIEEQIIRLLLKKYPITIKYLKENINISEAHLMRVIKKFQVKKILELEPLSNKTYIRLLRNDFRFIGKKRQRKFIKHCENKNESENEDYNGIMYH